MKEAATVKDKTGKKISRCPYCYEPAKITWAMQNEVQHHPDTTKMIITCSCGRTYFIKVMKKKENV